MIYLDLVKLTKRQEKMNTDSPALEEPCSLSKSVSLSLELTEASWEESNTCCLSEATNRRLF